MPNTASFDCHPLPQPPKYQQLFRPLGGSRQAVASKLTDSSKFKMAVKSDTDIPAIVFFVVFLFVLFCSFSLCLIFYLLFSFFVFFFFFSFFGVFSLIYVHVTVYINQGTTFSGL